MRKSFKGAALALACAMVIGSLAGCGGGNSQTDTTNTDTAANTTEGTSAFTDYSNGFPENVTISIPVYDRAFEGWDVTNNYYTKWIQENFGDKYNVTLKFTAIGRQTDITDFTQMLAAGTAPNIIFTYDLPQALGYNDEGAMQDLDLGEINYYAPTYFEKMGEIISRYGKVNDSQKFFFANRPDAYNWVTLIRQDWVDKVGMELPTNLEEYNELLKAWKDAGLGTGGGNLLNNYTKFTYAFRDWPKNEEEVALYSDITIPALTWDTTYEYLKNMNYQYNNGLIDPEFYLNKDDASTQADFVAGNSGVYGFYISANSTVISSLLANNPDAKLATLDPAYEVPEGNPVQSRAYWPFGMIMGINSKSTPEQRAAVWMYLEWMSQSDNLFFLQNGVEGENYTKAEDGIAVQVADFTGESKLSDNKNKDYWCLVIETATYEDESLSYKANIANWAPAGYEFIIENTYKYWNQYEEYRTTDALYSVPIESVTEYKATLGEMWNELHTKCIMAAEADFDKVYEEACKEFLDAGYQEILDERQKAFDAGQYTY